MPKTETTDEARGEAQLKPCPFCGATPEPLEGTPTVWVRHAKSCYISTSKSMTPRQQAAWNTRQPAVKKEEAQELRPLTLLIQCEDDVRWEDFEDVALGDSVVLWDRSSGYEFEIVSVNPDIRQPDRTESI